MRHIHLLFLGQCALSATSFGKSGGPTLPAGFAAFSSFSGAGIVESDGQGTFCHVPTPEFVTGPVQTYAGFTDYQTFLTSLDYCLYNLPAGFFDGPGFPSIIYSDGLANICAVPSGSMINGPVHRYSTNVLNVTYFKVTGVCQSIPPGNGGTALVWQGLNSNAASEGVTGVEYDLSTTGALRTYSPQELVGGVLYKSESFVVDNTNDRFVEWNFALTGNLSNVQAYVEVDGVDTHGGGPFTRFYSFTAGPSGLASSQKVDIPTASTVTIQITVQDSGCPQVHARVICRPTPVLLPITLTQGSIFGSQCVPDPQTGLCE